MNVQGFQSFPRLACRFTWCLNFLDESSCKEARFGEAHFITNTTIRCTTDSYIPLDIDCSELVSLRVSLQNPSLNPSPVALDPYVCGLSVDL